MRYLLLLLLSITIGANVFAQNQQSFQFEKIASLNMSDFSSSWHANVFSTEAPFPGSDSYRNFIHQQKLLYYGNAQEDESAVINHKSTNNEKPVYHIGFEGNFFGGIPNDNDIAISNDGVIVSVSNSDLFVFDESGTSILDIGLEDFADSLGLVANSYDPKVLYDPSMDRFILIFLNGNSSASTNIVVCFSQTEDPTQAWNVYSLDGNPFNNNAWSDFPMVAITEQDFYVTVNHINSDSASWQTGFMQSVIWQVQKSEGYAGGTIETVVHSNVNYDGSPIRNLLPIKGGFDLKNHEMVFISNRNFDMSNDTFFVVKIEESLEQNPSPSFTTEAILANQNYGMPPDAQQTATTFLQTNDARPLSGITEGGIIHFVGNTVRPTSTKASIYHGRINTAESPWTVDLEIFEDNHLEYGYPNLSFSGQSTYDEQVIISFNHTSIDSFPGVSAIYYSFDQGYSDRLHLASGNSKVNVISGSFERWGDYSGSQKKYNEPGTVWVNGFVGFKNNFAIPADQHRTYIAKLNSPDSLGTSITNLPNIRNTLFPNPVARQFYYEFELEQSEYLFFELYDMQGKLVDKLLEEQVKAGKNQFLFNMDPLVPGVYTLRVTNKDAQLICTDKIVKK